MKKQYYLKERHNPQTGVYYVKKGQMSRKELEKAIKSTCYGSDYYVPYATEEEYLKAIEKLISEGNRVH